MNQTSSLSSLHLSHGKLCKQLPHALDAFTVIPAELRGAHRLAQGSNEEIAHWTGNLDVISHQGNLKKRLFFPKHNRKNRDFAGGLIYS